MNERVPDSSGLPLRAMVMVLLFLGVIFLLVGLQAMGSHGSSDDDDSTSVTTVTTSTPAPAKGASAVHRSDVRVYNISGQEGVAGRTADQLKSAGFNVTEVGNLSLPDVAATTVYFSNTAGERDTADAVGKQLNAPVKPRIAAVADQPPGVIVAVAG
ncbi:MAG TPA: LytR C-terminal domain-containing protein [Mycobacterium sp.]|uniref:LytR C-terminal domain-containing protein n=1 Tax=Mycobacterium sp. TaxID=1785 RepID=UPI002D546B5A|nr:LytR C-terminal domain-containing protein [Mycobacterium sp.]HZU47203.1 LytR C-terminal domain-containing protein [Mycobacterium sp.]